MLILFRNAPFRGVKLVKSNFNLIQTANIMGRGTRGGPLVLPKPYPYEEKKFGGLSGFLDNTMLRVSEENAKIIVVEGPIGVGKSACAKILAEQLDMKFMPQPTMDELYILPSGYDLRVHDKELPESVRSYDHKNFCVSPNPMRAGPFQIQMLYLRFFQYVDALAHLLNTGQGVVLERSYFSDYVFLKAMYENKLVSPLLKDAYNEVLKNTGTFFVEPHLIIYLDIPVPVVQERIRTRNYSYEQNSPVLTKEYLESLEKYWKQDYLKSARKYSEILIYNWSDGGDVDLIIDDIEKLDFDNLRRDKKFNKWRIPRKILAQMRKKFTNEKWTFCQYFYVPRYYNVPELSIDTNLLIQRDLVYEQAPDCQFAKGYNSKLGDSVFNILFKSSDENYRRSIHYLHFKDDHEAEI